MQQQKIMPKPVAQNWNAFSASRAGA